MSRLERAATLGLRMLVVAASVGAALVTTGADALAADQPLLNKAECWNWDQKSMFEILDNRLDAGDDTFGGENEPGEAAGTQFGRDYVRDVSLGGGVEVPSSVLTGNDTIGGDELAESDANWQIRLYARPQHASFFTLREDGSFTWVPTPGYYGTDTFQYVLYLTGACSNVATVTIPAAKEPRLRIDSYAVEAIPSPEGLFLDCKNEYVICPDPAPAPAAPTFQSPGVCEKLLAPTWGELYRYCDLVNNDTIFTVPVRVWYTVNLETVLRSGTLDLAHGTLWDLGSGRFGYAPDPGFVGDDFFYYGLKPASAIEPGFTVAYGFAEGGGDSYTSLTTLAGSYVKVVLNVRPPVAAVARPDGPMAVPEDGSLAIDVGGQLLANDGTSTAHGEIASVQGIDPSFGLPASVRTAHGTLQIGWIAPLGTNPSVGTLTYVPDPDWYGPDWFTYRNRISQSNSTTTVTLDVVGSDDPPVAVADSARTTVGVPITIDVLANDLDPDNDLDVASIRIVNGAGSDITLQADHTVRYTPLDGYAGVRLVQYDVADSRGVRSVGNVAIRVTPLVEDAYSTDEDTALTVTAADGVLANDLEPTGGELLAASLAAPPEHGTVSLQGDGSFIYAPAADWFGTDTFTYSATGGQGLWTLAAEDVRVSITVRPVNDAPRVVLSACNLIANLVCPYTEGGSPILMDGWIEDVDGGKPGELVVDWGDGSPLESHAYPCQVGDASPSCTATIRPAPVVSTFGTPTPNRLYFRLSHVFRDDTSTDVTTVAAHAVDDKGLAGPDGTFRASVTNQPPTLVISPECPLNPSFCIGNFSFLRAEKGGTITIRGRVTDPGDDAVRLVVDWGDGTGALVDEICGTSACPYAAVHVENDCDPPTTIDDYSTACGYFTLTHQYVDAGLYPVTIRGADGDGGSTPTLTANVSITRPNAYPVANHDDWFFFFEDSPTPASPTRNLLSNDTDADPEDAVLTASLVTNVQHGSVTVNSDGTFSWTPELNWFGTTTFTYRACDTVGACDDATATLYVSPIDDAPIIVDDAYATDEDVPLDVAAPGVLANDSDIEGPVYVLSNQAPDIGTVVLQQNGSFVYTPPADWSGKASFVYTACDNFAGCLPATVRITVKAVNDTPDAVDDELSVVEEGMVVLDAPGVLGNDTDAEGEPLTPTLVSGPSHPLFFSFGPDGSVRYVPLNNFSGEDSFTYEACDPSGACDEATVTITVANVNDAPSATGASVTTDEDTAVDVALGDYGTDPDQDVLTGSVNGGPAHGSVVVTDGVARYTPSANYNGPDSFPYTVCDPSGECADGTVDVTVRPVDDRPVAGDDAFSVVGGTTLNVAAADGVLKNDSDVESAVTAVLVTGPAHGTLNLNANGSFSYTPAAAYIGSDSFTYKASDGSLESATATVSITVTDPNVAPVARNDSYSTNEDTALTVTAANGVLKNDSDANNDTLTASLVSGPSNGTLTLNASGSFTYTPAANWNGSDSFTYKANDGKLDSDTKTVTITVNAVNDAPTIAITGGSCTSDANPSGTVTYRAADIDSSSLTVTAANARNALLPAGSLSVDNAGRTVTVNAVATKNGGTVVVTLTVSDGSATGTTTVNVIVGTAKNETFTGTAGTDLIFGLAGADTIAGAGAIDILCGGQGDDVLRGGDGDDVLNGLSGADTLEGNAGDDSLLGGGGNDILRGGDGNDTLRGQGGADAFTGGAGTDAYADFSTAEGDSQTEAP